MSATTVTTIVTMLAEGHPVWFVAAQVGRHSRDVEAVARQLEAGDPVSFGAGLYHF